MIWQQADAALAQAVAVLNTGAANDDLQQRVAAMRAELQEGAGRLSVKGARVRTEILFDDLDKARLTMFAFSGLEIDMSRTTEQYAAAFARFGLEIQPGKPEVLAQRINAEEPTVRDALILALDNWAFCAAAGDARPAMTRNCWQSRGPRTRIRGGGPIDRPQWIGTARRSVRLSKEARTLDLPPTSLDLLARALQKLPGRRSARLAALGARPSPDRFLDRAAIRILAVETEPQFQADLVTDLVSFRLHTN